MAPPPHHPTVQAVVPAAGKGSRLRPLTADRPKGLVSVAGRPLLAHAFDALIAAGATEIVVVIGDDAIPEHFGDAVGDVPLTYVNQPAPRGLADAIARAEPHVDGPFLAYNGDNVCRADLERLWTRHREADADATLLVERVDRETAKTTGVVVPDGEGGVADVVEKPDDPPSTLVTRGVTALSARVFAACRAIEPSDRGEYELADAVAWLADTGRVETVRLAGWCHNVNTPADVRAVERRLDP